MAADSTNDLLGDSGLFGGVTKRCPRRATCYDSTHFMAASKKGAFQSPPTQMGQTQARANESFAGLDEEEDPQASLHTRARAQNPLMTEDEAGVTRARKAHKPDKRRAAPTRAGDTAWPEADGLRAQSQDFEELSEELEGDADDDVPEMADEAVMSIHDDSGLGLSARLRAAEDEAALSVGHNLTGDGLDALEPEIAPRTKAEIPANEEPAASYRPDENDVNATRAGPPFRLEVVEGPDQGQTVRFKGVRMVLGRTSGVDFQLSDQSVSRRHVELVHSDDGVLMRDLGSGNGTKVNDKKVAEKKLAHDDVIWLGKTKIRFVDENVEMEAVRAAAEAKGSVVDSRDERVGSPRRSRAPGVEIDGPSRRSQIRAAEDDAADEAGDEAGDDDADGDAEDDAPRPGRKSPKRANSVEVSESMMNDLEAVRSKSGQSRAGASKSGQSKLGGSMAGKSRAGSRADVEEASEDERSDEAGDEEEDRPKKRRGSRASLSRPGTQASASALEEEAADSGSDDEDSDEGEDDEDEAEEKPKRRRRGQKSLAQRLRGMPVQAKAAIGVGLAAALVFGIGAIVTLRDKEAAIPKVDPNKAVAESNVLSARTAVKEKRFQDAVTLLEEAERLYPGTDRTGLLPKARAELTVQQGVEQVRELAKQSRFEDAHKALEKVPEDSIYFEEDRKAVTKELYDAEVKYWSEKVMESLASGDVPGAETNLRKLPPEAQPALAEEIRKLKEQQLEAEKDELGRKRSAAAAAAAAAEAKKREAMALAFAVVERKFNSGEWDRAASECTRVIDNNATDNDILERAKVLKGLIPIFGKAYEEGTKKFRMKQYVAAVKPLSDARRTYRSMGLTSNAYGNDMDTMLLDCLIAQGNEAMSRENLYDAIHAFREALKLDQFHPRAKQAVHDIESRADELFMDAYKLEEGDRTRALKMYKLIQEISAPGSTVHEKAKNRIQAMLP